MPSNQTAKQAQQQNITPTTQANVGLEELYTISGLAYVGKQSTCDGPEWEGQAALFDQIRRLAGEAIDAVELNQRTDRQHAA